MAQQEIRPSFSDIRNRIDQLLNLYQAQPDTSELIDPFIEDLSGILAEFQLRGSETRLADIADCLEENPNPVLRIDREGKILHANSVASIILMDWDRQAGQVLPAVWLDRIRQVFHSGKKQTFDIEVGGRWISILMVPLLEAGTVNLYGYDITERKQAEEDLRYQADLLENIHDAVFATDLNLRITAWNKAAEQLYGWTNAEAIGKIVNRLLQSEFSVDEQQAILRQLKEVGPFVGEAVLHAKDGRRIIVESHTVLRRRLDGQPAGIISSNRDITERKQAEQALRQSEEKFRTIADFTYDWEYWIDNDSRLLYNSPACERITGRSHQDFFTNPDLLVEIVHPQDRAMFEQHLQEYVGSAEAASLDFRILTSDGQERWIGHRCQPVFSSDGKLMGRRISNRDITEEKQVEAAHKLNRTLKALGDSRLAMMRAEDETSFLNEVCRIVVEDCGHAMAWIGFAEEDAAKSVRPVAHAGYEAGYLDKLHLTWADTERGRGPTGTAIRTGKPGLSRHILTDPRMEPWRADAIQRGYASSIVLPFLPDGAGSHSQEDLGRKAFGAISIYSREPDPFSEDEVRLLTELANDLSYGISVIRMKAARRLAEAALRRNEAEARARAAELETIMNTTPAIIYVSRDPECRLMVSNQVGYDFLKMPPGSNVSATAPSDDRPTHITSKKDGALIPPEELPMQIAARTGIPQRGYECDVEYENGESRRMFGNVAPIFDEEGHPSGAVGIFVDISERARAEAETRRLGAELEIRRSLLEQREQERLQVARDLHDGPVQELTAATFVLRGLLLGECSPEVAGQLEAVQASLQAQIQELRDYAGELRPPSLSKFGLEKALRSHAEVFQEKHPEMQIQLDVHFIGDLLPDPIRLALFRIYQQALANIVKHAQASEIHVQLIKDERQVRLAIRDNGQGFELPKEWLVLVRQGHLGLVGMRERAEAVGGKLEIHSLSGKGTTLAVIVPLTKD